VVLIQCQVETHLQERIHLNDKGELMIDPCAVGGGFSLFELQNFSLKGEPDRSPLIGGDENLRVAMILKSRLQSLGAEVFLTRQNYQGYVMRDPEDMSKIPPENIIVDPSVGNDTSSIFYVSRLVAESIKGVLRSGYAIIRE